jgi:peptidoglycan hydrolase CwlO-like protein
VAEPLFTIAVQHTVTFESPVLAQAILGGLQAIATAQSAMEKRIMGALEDLQTKTEQLIATNGQLLAQLEEGNTKTDLLIEQNGQLIVVATTTKDALVAARDEIARLQAAQGAATAEQLVAITAQLDSAILAAQGGIDAANAQDAQTDAATAATGAAAGAVAP